MVAAGARVDIQNNMKETALYHAVRAKQPNCIRALLFHGADPNVANSNGDTPVAKAKRNGMDIYFYNAKDDNLVSNVYN